MRTTADDGKRQLLAHLAETRRQIVSLASSLPPEHSDEVFLGSWTIKDLLAHLVGWDLANLQAMRDVLAGELPGFYAHHDRDWRAFNDRLVREHGKVELGELLTCLAASHGQLLACLEAVPAEEFDRDRGLRFRGWKVTIAKLLRAEAEDEAEHYQQILAFATRWAITRGESS